MLNCVNMMLMAVKICRASSSQLNLLAGHTGQPLQAYCATRKKAEGHTGVQ